MPPLYSPTHNAALEIIQRRWTLSEENVCRNLSLDGGDGRRHGWGSGRCYAWRQKPWSIRSKTRRAVQPSKWPWQPIMTRNQLLRENWCWGSRASCGGCVAPPQSGAVRSRSRRNICFSSGDGSQAHRQAQEIIDGLYRNALATE